MKDRILILEDDKINQKLIELYLIDAYDIEIVDSVEEAIDAVSKSTFNLIISGLNLGDGTKDECIDFLKYINFSNLSINLLSLSLF